MSRPGIIFEKRRRHLVPASAIDAEDFDAMPEGTQVELTVLSHRSSAQLRAYWKALDDIVKATGMWATRYHLHDALRRDLGYIHVQRDLAGEPYLAVDSTAFDAMKPDEFNAYFEAAMQRLAEVTGINPTAFIDEKRAA
jgi:hypothetical protein